MKEVDSRHLIRLLIALIVTVTKFWKTIYDRYVNLCMYEHITKHRSVRFQETTSSEPYYHKTYLYVTRNERSKHGTNNTAYISARYDRTSLSSHSHNINVNGLSCPVV